MRRKCGTSQGPGADRIREMHAHVGGFHFYRADLKRARRVDHSCAHRSGGDFQCVLLDSGASDARLIGVEYIVGEAMFAALPTEEKERWHNHRYEVMSGLLTAPDASAAAGNALMHELVNTYAKPGTAGRWAAAMPCRSVCRNSLWALRPTGRSIRGVGGGRGRWRVDGGKAVRVEKSGAITRRCGSNSRRTAVRREKNF